MTTRTRTWIGIAIFAMTAVGIYPLLSPLRLKPANLILITLDTNGADELGPYGGQAHVMPTLETWAKKGLVFDDASTAVPLTLPAHTSLMTGRTAAAAGIRDNDGILDDEAPTLAEALQSVGFKTGAFVSSVVLDKRHGLGAGFDVYGEVNHAGAPVRTRRPANETVDEALGWLQSAADDAFFLWVHLDDSGAAGLPDSLWPAYQANPSGTRLAFVDGELRRIQAFLDAHQLTSRTAIVVAADRRALLTEGVEASQRGPSAERPGQLPLIVDWPGGPSGHVATAVQLADIAPTVMALDAAPRFDTDGCSLEPLFRGQPMLARPFVTEASTQR